MGNTVSNSATNVVNSHNEVLTSIINSTDQNCNSACFDTAEYNFDCENTVNCSFDPTLDQQCTINATCIENQNTQNCLYNQLEETAQQSAQAASGALNGSILTGNYFNNTSNFTDNLTYLFNELNQEVYNNIQQNCYASAFNAAFFNVTCKEDQTCTFASNVNQIADVTLSCSLSGSYQNEITNLIKEQVDQMASATSKSNLAGAILLLIMVGIIFGVIFFAKKLTSWKVVLLVIFVIGIGVGIYFLYCYIEKCGIFTPNPEHTPGATSNQINQLSYTGLKGDLTQAGCTTCPSTTINGPVIFEAMYVPFAIDGLYE